MPRIIDAYREKYGSLLDYSGGSDELAAVDSGAMPAYAATQPMAQRILHNENYARMTTPRPLPNVAAAPNPLGVKMAQHQLNLAAGTGQPHAPRTPEMQSKIDAANVQQAQALATLAARKADLKRRMGGGDGGKPTYLPQEAVALQQQTNEYRADQVMQGRQDAAKQQEKALKERQAAQEKQAKERESAIAEIEREIPKAWDDGTTKTAPTAAQIMERRRQAEQLYDEQQRIGSGGFTEAQVADMMKEAGFIGKGMSKANPDLLIQMLGQRFPDASDELIAEVLRRMDSQ